MTIWRATSADQASARGSAACGSQTRLAEGPCGRWRWSLTLRSSTSGRGTSRTNYSLASTSIGRHSKLLQRSCRLRRASTCDRKTRKCGNEGRWSSALDLQLQPMGWGNRIHTPCSMLGWVRATRSAMGGHSLPACAHFLACATATPVVSDLLRRDVFEGVNRAEGHHLRRSHGTESKQQTLAGREGRRIFGGRDTSGCVAI